jgi:hypothetical protein
VAELLAEAAAAEALAAERTTRVPEGDTDCIACAARGFVTIASDPEQPDKIDAFSWCEICEHTGRVASVRSSAGYWAVRRTRLGAFVAGELDAHETDAVSLGEQLPPRRYPDQG